MSKKRGNIRISRSTFLSWRLCTNVLVRFTSLLHRGKMIGCGAKRLKEIISTFNGCVKSLSGDKPRDAEQ